MSAALHAEYKLHTGTGQHKALVRKIQKYRIGSYDLRMSFLIVSPPLELPHEGAAHAPKIDNDPCVSCPSIEKFGKGAATFPLIRLKEQDQMPMSHTCLLPGFKYNTTRVSN